MRTNRSVFVLLSVALLSVGGMTFAHAHGGPS